MLDTNARHTIQPLLDVIARTCSRLGISANALTVAGMLTGVAAAGLVAAEHTLAGFVVLWLSGLIDAADGTLARLTSPARSARSSTSPSTAWSKSRSSSP